MSKFKIYLMLSISILTEVFAATMLKVSEGFEFFLPLVGVAIGYFISFTFLGIVLKYMPLSTAYAIWAGVGTICTAVISAIMFGEVFTVLKTIGILIIISGIVVLNLSDKATASAEKIHSVG